MKLLIIDDSKTITRSAGVFIRGLEDCQLFDAEDGLDGIRIALREKPDLILVDTMMPFLDGFSTIRLLRILLGPNVRIINLTGKNSLVAQEMAIFYGADGFKTKPFEKAWLLAQIEETKQGMKATVQ